MFERLCNFPSHCLIASLLFFSPSYLSVFVRPSVLRRVSSLPFPFCFLPSVSVFSATHSLSLSPSVSFEDLCSLLIYWGVLSAYKAPVKISDAITLFCIASREKSLFRFSGGLKVWRRFSKKQKTLFSSYRAMPHRQVLEKFNTEKNGSR